jgi:hypothetical protein
MSWDRQHLAKDTVLESIIATLEKAVPHVGRSYMNPIPVRVYYERVVWCVYKRDNERLVSVRGELVTNRNSGTENMHTLILSIWE